jgi:ornithine cyclodeaminase/alanine dehydrogenase-like protein (mu-crystallin family)
LEETADSDILCTLTPSRKPFVKKAWIKAGTHVNAVGADAPGKEELAPSILREAMVMVDDMEQASVAGEINVPLKKGLFKASDIYATLGEIVAGKKRGRYDEKSITVFDSTGLAIEDIAVARLIYEKAKRKGGYLSLDFVEG